MHAHEQQSTNPVGWVVERTVKANPRLQIVWRRIVLLEITALDMKMFFLCGKGAHQVH